MGDGNGVDKPATSTVDRVVAHAAASGPNPTGPDEAFLRSYFAHVDEVDMQ